MFSWSSPESESFHLIRLLSKSKSIFIAIKHSRLIKFFIIHVTGGNVDIDVNNNQFLLMQIKDTTKELTTT
ncbi:MAG: hypothetical protein JKX78_08740 [Alteromonadaceae bacterium]|nr:hypothetical protein [Alteromonadaceae bacterium]